VRRTLVTAVVLLSALAGSSAQVGTHLPATPALPDCGVMAVPMLRTFGLGAASCRRVYIGPFRRAVAPPQP
jgi:hypothetical protein